MNRHIFSSISSQSESFGLVAWLEQTRVVLPLKGVECRFDVCGELVNVEIDQIFYQENKQALDCLYTFPLPGGAAVYRCELHVNDRIIRAKVEEKEKAREIAQQQKQAGHRTALVEMERENLFTLSLGNVQPGDIVVVRFAYFQTVDRLEDWTSFQVPFCPGIRYIPGDPLLRPPSGRGAVDDTNQVPDASRISPPRIDQFHPDAAYLAVEGLVRDPLQGVSDLSSPTHPVVICDGQGDYTIRIANGVTVPDRDFVLRWSEPVSQSLQAVGWVAESDDEAYAMVRLQGPARSQASEESVVQDTYFLVDRSVSMHGMKWERAAQAFEEFVKRLNPKDRVWLTAFESRFQDYAEIPLPASVLLAQQPARGLKELGTAGGTELWPALEHVLQMTRKHSPGQTVSLLILTDGQIGNEAMVLNELKRHPNVRVHTFGIDTAVNDAFLRRIAKQQGGSCHLFTPQDDLVGTVARFGGRLDPPMLVDLVPGTGWEGTGSPLPNLHAGQSLSVPLKAAGGTRSGWLEGRKADGSIQRIPFELQALDNPALRLSWARERIDQFIQANDAFWPVTIQLMEILILWVLTLENTEDSSWKSLEQLLDSLQQAPSDRSTRMELVEKWIDNNLSSRLDELKWIRKELASAVSC